VHRFGPACDFFAVFSSGIRARDGQPIYTFGDSVSQIPYAYAFRYAPMVAYTLGLALSFLNYLAAYGLWLVLCELALLRNIRLTLERAPDRTTGTLCAALWLLFSPYYIELYVGQFTFITASLMFWAYLGWSRPPSKEARSAYRAADFFFAVAVRLKMMPLLFLPVVLLQKRWKAAFISIVVLVVTSAIYFHFAPSDWKMFVKMNSSAYPTWHAGNQGFMAFLFAVSGERTGAFLTYRLVATVLLGVLLTVITYAGMVGGQEATSGCSRRSSGYI